MAPAVAAVTSIVVPITAPVMAMGAVTSCVHPDIKTKVIIVYKVIFFMERIIA